MLPFITSRTRLLTAGQLPRPPSKSEADGNRHRPVAWPPGQGGGRVVRGSPSSLPSAGNPFPAGRTQHREYKVTYH